MYLLIVNINIIYNGLDLIVDRFIQTHIIYEYFNFNGTGYEISCQARLYTQYSMLKTLCTVAKKMFSSEIPWNTVIDM